MLGILMFGIMAYRLLPVSDLPNVDFPTITVSAGLPGASPQTMAAAVATPLEKQFSTIAGIDAMTSSSTLGGTNITLQFTLSRDIDGAAQDVQAAISKTLRQLPPGIQPPSYNKSNPADSPILYLTLTSATMPLQALDEDGAPVRLGDVARVLDDVQDSRNASWYDGKRAIGLAIQRQPGTNTVEVADAVKATVATLSSQLPASVEVNTLYDRSVSIRQSVNDVQLTLFITLCLVVLVIFLFLKNLSATIIPSLALPFSIIGTFSVMYLMGYSLDNLSLMALTLSVGFVVDDAIVMLENIVRHLEMGKRPMEAALDGAREIGFTIPSMTLMPTAVFIPVLLMDGIIGRPFHRFAVTI